MTLCLASGLNEMRNLRRPRQNLPRALDRLSFDPTTYSRLSTDIGLLNLELPNQTPAMDAQSTEAISQRTSHSGYGISGDGVWVVKDGMNMLWLPPEYRPEQSAVVQVVYW
ncbi:unnamed protein product [Fusarium venenatum]|uniref:Uncharacterized protein n=2 Tax=Fusarium venenatum TaxID=56646 RepID=A0A2L2TD29_9HYPO|nr:uncharacterized protein FVRRES_07936 [Fusarium venenatum]CEI67859.1 unnamed protein product [Fusarium venenatum]